MRFDVGHDHRGGEQIVGRNVEKALQLAGVQIDGQHPVRSGPGDQIGDELGRNGRARALFAILAGVAEIGNHRGYPPRRRAPQRVDHDQQLHQVIIGGRRGGLDDESVLSPHVLQNLDPDFLIRETSDHGPAKRDSKMRGDRLGQRPVGVARQKFHRRH